MRTVPPFSSLPKDILGQRLLDVLLDHPGQRPRAIERIEALLRQPFADISGSSIKDMSGAPLAPLESGGSSW
jgi:hypothetical protein